VLVRAAAVLAACLGIYRLAVVPLRSDLVLREVEQRTATALRVDERRAAVLARMNLDELQRTATGGRLDPSWYLLRGANCELLERWQDAADAYTQALRIDDRPEIYFNRGLVMMRVGRIDAAVRDLTKAARFDPTVLERIDGETRRRVAAAAGLP
jgi:tetratricopeptide (TPR) repeat protein